MGYLETGLSKISKNPTSFLWKFLGETHKARKAAKYVQKFILFSGLSHDHL